MLTTSGLLLLLTAPTSLAGPEDPTGRASVDDIANARFTICRQDAEDAVRRGDTDGGMSVWVGCLDTARADADGALERLLAAKVATMRLERDYGDLQRSDPHEYARVVLALVAQNPGIDLPQDLIRTQWIQLVSDTHSRQNLAIRQVTVRVLTAQGLSDEDKVALEAYLRRFAIDCGFKAPEGYSKEASESDVFVQVEAAARSETLGASSRATLYGEEISLKASSVRFKKRNTRGEAIAVVGEGSYVVQAQARTEALEAAASAFADQLLLRVITELFSSYQLPSP